ncbi:MAG: bifunctional hydroxymethylpyrimidine kinase/phosphomethylpyrimidine kinase [Prochlorotrichaceae cyanobacterium]|jgi:hydroxymethylpyrimidine/phosphomethylpyrimidine kinase
MTPLASIPVALTIAGSDSGGGAGIQADLRTFAFHRVHGTSALTCVTAQNTCGVDRVDALPPEAVVAQIQSIVTDIGVQAVKTGMLLNVDIIAAVAEQIERWSLPHLVVDPVMVSRAGVQLIDDAAIALCKTRLVPLAQLLTPNRYEAEILSGLDIQNLEDMRQAARRILGLGCHAVLVKGGGLSGHLKGVDLWWDGQIEAVLETECVNTPHTHGTGCTLSAAIVANLALGTPLKTAVESAKQYVTQALHHSLAIGRGQGPVGHFFPLLNSH